MIQLAANWSPAFVRLLTRVCPPVESVVLLHPTEQLPTGVRAVRLRCGRAHLMAVSEMNLEAITVIDAFATNGDLLPLPKIRTEPQILIENPPYIDVEKLNRAIDMYDIQICLNIAHIAMSAHARSHPTLAYVEKIPTSCVKSLRISATSIENQILRTNHLKLQKEDYVLLEKVLMRFLRVEAIELDYGGYPDTETDSTRVLRWSRNNPADLLENLAHLDTLRKRVGGTLRMAPKIPVRTYDFGEIPLLNECSRSSIPTL